MRAVQRAAEVTVKTTSAGSAMVGWTEQSIFHLEKRFAVITVGKPSGREVYKQVMVKQV